MRASTVVIGGAAVIGAGGLAWWLATRKKRTTGSDSATSSAPGASGLPPGATQASLEMDLQQPGGLVEGPLEPGTPVWFLNCTAGDTLDCAWVQAMIDGISDGRYRVVGQDSGTMLALVGHDDMAGLRTR